MDIAKFKIKPVFLLWWWWGELTLKGQEGVSQWPAPGNSGRQLWQDCQVWELVFGEPPNFLSPLRSFSILGAFPGLCVSH